MVPLVMPEAVAVAVREVLPVCVVVPGMLVHPVFTVEKHMSYEATPLMASVPVFHDADRAVVLADQVTSLLKLVERSKMLLWVGLVGVVVSMVKPLEHCQVAVTAALSVVRMHV